MYEYLCNVS